MPYRLSSLAERDLDEIWSYVAENASPATADRLIDDIIDRFDLLTEHPGMGRQRAEFGPGVRSITVENYVVYYCSEGDVLIARILHGRRDQIAAWSGADRAARRRSARRKLGQVLSRAVFDRTGARTSCSRRMATWCCDSWPKTWARSWTSCSTPS